jgi:pyruvate kinase
MIQPYSQNASFQRLIQQLTTLRAEMIELERRHIAASGRPHPNNKDSQRNLLHYLAFRRRDLRSLQQELAALGLSSLGRAESHVLASVDAVLNALSLIGKMQGSRPLEMASGLQIGDRLLETHSQDLLGPGPAGRTVRIVVTLPSEAETEYSLVHSLLEEGMDVARINCAHEGPAAWDRMIRHVRRAARVQGRSCRILMDLAGPKLRTGPVEPGLAVQKWRPTRDALGSVLLPARVWLTCAQNTVSPPSEADATLPVPGDWMRKLRPGDKIHVVDARGSNRCVTIVDVTDQGCWGESRQTAYIIPGLSLRRQRDDASEPVATVGDFDPTPGFIELSLGDVLILTRQLQQGRAATRDSAGTVLTPAQIACTLPEIFEDVQVGERIFFDDGRIGGIIERVELDRIFIRVTQAKAGGEKLRSEKGINLPDSSLRLPAMTTKDLEDLNFVAAHADIVGLSFAQDASDVEMLVERLRELGKGDLGIVLKIETRRGFEQLPSMLLAGMKCPSLGVMIARGDLAVECGFERMAEVQEEILWICEAAQCPVIWATQVLETLAREGFPSRAEITDAAMGHRAEAVMLNKGPHILKAVETLGDILQRMEAHQNKKKSMLCELGLARGFHTLNGKNGDGLRCLNHTAS